MISPKEFERPINLNLGQANAMMCAADLTKKYVDFNKGDVTDASSLGGQFSCLTSIGDRWNCFRV